MKCFLSSILSLVFAISVLAQPQVDKVTKPTPAGTPTFSLAWSEYPSWSAFDVASSGGLIDGRKGYMGKLEIKWGVDIELKFLDYDPCIAAYGENKVDAVCITNIDILSPSLGRKSVAILPTSTSYGADALIVPTYITTFGDLKGKVVYGLGKSVSEFGIDGILEVNDAKLLGITFSSMDPGAAATAVQQNDSKVQCIMVWNPYVLQTLRNAKDSFGNPRTHVLADSTAIPLQIIDMVVAGDDVISKPGGSAFASCIAETFYGLNGMLADPSSRDDTLIAIGEKFSSLGLADMRKVVDQTRFFATAEDGIKVFDNQSISIGNNAPTNLREIMKKVVARCVSLEMVKPEVKIGYGNDEEARKANIRFDPQYMIAVAKSLGGETPKQTFPPSPGNSPPVRRINDSK